MNVIVMSTYNGEAYLQKQLDSVLNQTVRDFVLLVRDDGSSDSTVQLLKDCADPRIRLLTGGNLGPSGSFFALLEEAKNMGADFVFFCDQDDIWLPDKLERQLAEIKKLTGPALVFSDFSMIDGDGRVTGDSYTAMASLRIPQDGNFFPKLLAQPYVFGCASVLNRALLDLITAPPAGIEMYDCWIALVCAIFGTVRYMPDATLHHRFHSSNATGRSGMNSLSARLQRVTKQLKKQIANTNLRLHQAQLLLDRYGDTLPADSVPMLNALAKAGRTGGICAVRTLKQYGVSRGGALQNIFFRTTAFLNKGEH